MSMVDHFGRQFVFYQLKTGLFCQFSDPIKKPEYLITWDHKKPDMSGFRIPTRKYFLLVVKVLFNMFN